MSETVEDGEQAVYTPRTNPAKVATVQAMLEQGLPYRTIRDATGLSLQTITNLGKARRTSPEHVERIKRGLRDQFALITHELLKSVTPKRINEASLGEVMRAAAIASDRAGIGPVSHHEVYSTFIQKYTTDSPSQHHNQ
ncbi:MAG TPA: hypothetical protein VFS39_15030 [Nitrospira sp.]|nr:hypothetical protein [Nitrospira sp.]